MTQPRIVQRKTTPERLAASSDGVIAIIITILGIAAAYVIPDAFSRKA